jgi:pyrroline-5-carboxylate reductase
MSSSATASALAQINAPLVLAGAGKMGGAMLAGWLAQGLEATRVVVIEPYPSDEIRALVTKGVRLNPSAKDVGVAATLVVALKPQLFREAGPDLKPFAGPATLVVSIMAGTTIAAIETVCGSIVVRAMPNTPAAIGRGITVAVASKNVSADQRAVADALLRATGAVEWVDDEGLMDAVTAVSGSGPAYVFLLAEELARAGVAAGLPADLATKLARETVAASLRACIGHAAPERHLARRHHRRGTGSADGKRRHAAAADACGRRRDAALEGIGEVNFRPHPERSALCARLEGWQRVPPVHLSFETRPNGRSSR